MILKTNSSFVIWITGLSGAGKSTVGKIVYDKIQPTLKNVVLLDGDELRKVMYNNKVGYSLEDRKNVAMSYSRLCKMLVSQNISVIISTISMFHIIHQWNRKNIPNYIEIYLDVPIATLKKRNNKKIYSNKDNVIGIDLDYEIPFNPDLIFINDDKNSVRLTSEKIISYINEEFGV